MEFATLRRPTTAAADNVETGRLRRFPDLPPPPQGDANASPVNAALARRREELLLELNKARIHQDMILLELVETEQAMGFTAAGHNPVQKLSSSQDYWRCRTWLVPPLEESPPRSSTEHSGCSGPAAVRVPPVYPYVEWSPPPLQQPRPASDTEMQKDCRSSGSRTHPFDGYVELCQSPNRGTLAEEASVPAAANPGARPTVHEAPGHKDVAGGECKSDMEDGHGIHPLYESENQSIRQRKTAETTPVDQINGPMVLSGGCRLADQEGAAFDEHKGREFSVLTPEQPRLSNGAEQKQECRSPGAKAHAFNGYAELCLSPSKQAPVEETLVPVGTKAGISPMQSALSFGKEAASGHQQAFGGEHKADVEDGHDVQPLGDIRNQNSGQRKALESAMEDRTDKPARPPGQYRLAGQGNAAYNEQKKVELSESMHERTSDELKRKLDAAISPVKKRKKRLRKHSCTICQVNMPSPLHLEEHLGGKLHRSIVTALQSSRNGAAEPNTKPTPAWKTIMAMNESVEGSGSQQGGNPHLKSFSHRSDTGKFYCKVCDVRCYSEKVMEDHLGGRKHRVKAG